MSKRRYSDEFYSELDALIRLQAEQSSSKKIEVLEVVQGGEQKIPAEHYEPIYKDSRSLLKMVKTNRLFLYLLIFAAVFTFAATSGMFAVYKQQEKSERMKQLGKIQTHKAEVDKPKYKTLNYSENREQVKVTAKNAASNWSRPKSGAINMVIDPKEKLKMVPKGKYNPGIDAEVYLPKTKNEQMPDEKELLKPAVSGETPAPSVSPTAEISPVPGLTPQPVVSPEASPVKP
ncbi:MAG: hypothetical protein LWY06_11835 [Firmicutes bacterium]|nr:hypothetical protein [Bacillota bacterium]